METKPKRTAQILHRQDKVQIWRDGKHRVYSVKKMSGYSLNRLYNIEDASPRSHVTSHGFVAYWKE